MTVGDLGDLGDETAVEGQVDGSDLASGLVFPVLGAFGRGQDAEVAHDHVKGPGVKLAREERVLARLVEADMTVVDRRLAWVGDEDEGRDGDEDEDAGEKSMRCEEEVERSRERKTEQK